MAQGKKKVVCRKCGVYRVHIAHGLCNKCYTRVYRMTEEEREQLNEFCITSNPKLGRPKKWTDDVIKKFADGFIEYSEKKTSLTMGAYATQFRFSPKIIPMLVHLSPYFSDAYEQARRNIGERREVGAMLKKLDARVWERYARLYDSEYNEHCKKILEEEEYIKAKAKLNALSEGSSEIKVLLEDLAKL